MLNNNDTSVHLTLSRLVVHLLWHVWYKREIYRLPVAKPEGKKQTEDLRVDGRKTFLLKWILEK